MSEYPAETTRPAVTVVIPTFAAPPAQLAAAVSSARRARGVAGVVVVDDGSPEPAASELSRPGAGVELIRTANSGPSAARNAGAARARTPWVCFLDDDDELIGDALPAALQVGVSLGADAVVSARVERRSDARTIRDRVRPAPPEWAGRTLPTPGAVFRPIAIFGASGLLVAARVFEAGLRFDESLWIGEDRDFLRRIAGRGPLAVSGVPLVVARVGGAGPNLTGPRWMERRIADHAVLVERWHDAGSDDDFRSATAWLAKAAARANVGDGAWATLTALCARRGWPVPFRARVRRMLRTGDLSSAPVASSRGVWP